MVLTLKQIKRYMLDEYNRSFNNIFKEHHNNQTTSSECIRKINQLNTTWDLARIDIKNNGKEENTIKFLEYEKNQQISYPRWFSNRYGKGCTFESKNRDINVIFKCINEGKLKIYLKSKDIRYKNAKRIPIYINFQELTINNENIFKRNIVTSHDEDYVFEKKCENNEIILLNVKFTTLFDYFPHLKISVNKEIDDSELNMIYKKINHYIMIEKGLMNNFPLE